MVEPEVAFLEFEGLCELAEEFVVYLVGRVLDRAREELKVLERDTAKLEAVVPPVPAHHLHRGGRDPQPRRATPSSGATTSAATRRRSSPASSTGRSWSPASRRPSRPSTCSRTRSDPETVLGLDILAPEGYGEIIGGSQRIHDHDLLLERIRQHNLPVEAFQWYLDVRRYGAFPHSGFGMGIERFVAWMCGLSPTCARRSPTRACCTRSIRRRSGPDARTSSPDLRGPGRPGAHLGDHMGGDPPQPGGDSAADRGRPAFHAGLPAAARAGSGVRGPPGRDGGRAPALVDQRAS